MGYGSESVYSNCDICVRLIEPPASAGIHGIQMFACTSTLGLLYLTTQQTFPYIVVWTPLGCNTHLQAKETVGNNLSISPLCSWRYCVLATSVAVMPHVDVERDRETTRWLHQQQWPAKRWTSTSNRSFVPDNILNFQAFLFLFFCLVTFCQFHFT